MGWTLPPLPDRLLLADLCAAASRRERVNPLLVEKDFHLTRLLAALHQRLGASVLLKGGTLLSKVDLGFFRMSEDVDLVLDGEPSRHGRANAARMEPLRTALFELAPLLGAALPLPGGERHERNSHVLWMLKYESNLGKQEIQVEATIHPVMRSTRRVGLRQLLEDPLLGDYAGARCQALSAAEARAEKVRAAFQREAGRDFYDLQRLMEARADLSSPAFVGLVDKKLAEVGFAPLAKQGPRLALDGKRLRDLEVSIRRDLPPVLREDARPFDLEAMLHRFEGLWPHDHARRGQQYLPGRGRERG